MDAASCRVDFPKKNKNKNDKNGDGNDVNSSPEAVKVRVLIRRRQ